MRKSSVILLSGGLDSAANLAFCAERDEPVLALTVLYGQRSAENELRAARELSSCYGVRHEVVDLRWLGAFGGSALTDVRRDIPDPGGERLDDLSVTRRTAAAVWVPNRNGVFVNVAAAFAERLGAVRVVVGFNREEAATFPDNSEEFLKETTRALSFSTANRVELFSYTTRMNKREIVAALRGLARPFPFESIWSCYAGGERPCGACESCRRLKRALEVS
ncbi:MAG: 7-cyano-7-deazaguanine synthase QueC [Oligoflexia bacterium]|nr:7-cyano-7-deazaguanine synthase QueC [Oligoflexia bacterium]